MLLKDKITMFLLVILLAATGTFAFLWQSEKVTAEVAKQNVIEAEKKASELNAKMIQDLANYNAKVAIVTKEANDLVHMANQKHKEELYEIQSKYIDAVNVTNSMRVNIAKINSELSNLSRTTIENYATTASNHLSECAGVTAEMEQIARGYNSEIEFLLAAWPRQVDPATVEDKSKD